MAKSGSYIDELQNELKQTDPDSHANRLVTQGNEKGTFIPLSNFVHNQSIFCEDFYLDLDLSNLSLI